MATLLLRLLGTYAVSLDGRPVEAFATDKERALLAYLVVENGRPHRRDALAALLWPDLPAEKARNNFRVTLHRLRKTVDHPESDVVEATRETVRLKPAVDVQVDVGVLADRLEGVRRHDEGDGLCPECRRRLAEAAELYGGPFLAGFTLEDGQAFNEWARLKREWLHRRALDGLAKLAQCYGRRGEIEAAQKVAYRQLELEPWRESAHRQLMRALACAGEYSAALAQFDACRQILADELDLEPSEKTERLYEEILVARETRFRPLPNAPGPFIGRERELEQITDQLAGPACRMLTLVGPGGIGKSRLALEVARKQTRAFLHGVCYVPLAAVDSAERLIGAIARAANYQFQNRRGRRSELLGYLQKKEMLLVLDNFEHLLEARELLRASLAHAPGLKALVTSRVRLNLKDENVFALRGLAVPEQDGAKGGDQVGAVKLFVERAREAHPRFELEPEARSATVALCRFLAGMPLAIELAASWSRVLTPGETLARIRHSLDFLESPSPDAPDRHRSMRASFEHSWTLLENTERDALMKLSTFRGGFTVEAAQAVAGASLQTLTTLVDHSLLWHDGPAGRLDMHELLREFAGDKLRQTGQSDAIRDAHGDYYLRILAGRLPDLKGRDQLGALDAIEEDFENVRAAWNWAIRQGQWQHIPQAAQSLYLFVLFRNRHLDGIELFEAARRAIPSPVTKTERLAHAYASAGEHGARYWRYWRTREEALAEVSELQAALQGLGDPAAIAYCRMMVGQTMMDEAGPGEVRAEATEALEAARAHYQRAQDPFYRAMALWRLGSAHLLGGQREEALGLYHRALSLAREAGDRYVAAALLHNLGAKTWDLEGPTEAVGAYLREATSLNRELNAPAGYAFSLAHLAQVPLWREGDLTSSRRMLEEAHAISAEQNLRRETIPVRLAVHRLLEGEYEKVLPLTEEALALVESNPWGWYWPTFQRGVAFFALGEVDEAVPLMKRALSRALAVSHVAWLCVCLAYCSVVMARQGEHERAAGLLALGLTGSHRGGLAIDPLLARTRAEAEEALGEEAFAAAWERGKDLDPLAVADDVLAWLEAAG